jgi:pantoate--beta-alanine ligase
MQIARTIADFKPMRPQWQSEGSGVALVPTMGALHEGHMSLIKRARGLAPRVVVSIFVNPTQFGPHEDFENYPRLLERDLEMLEEVGVDAAFIPEVAEMYPPGFKTFVTVEELGSRLCGVSRPTHFRGVTTVVLKLFNIIQPHIAVFGQKDAQQTVIIHRMVRDLGLDVDIVVCPIVREPDGLALSSRNRYLTSQERQAATILSRCLDLAEQTVKYGENRAAVLLDEIRRKMASEPRVRLDYAEIVDCEDLSPIETIEGPALLALAVFVGKTRLIDNTYLRRFSHT